MAESADKISKFILMIFVIILAILVPYFFLNEGSHKKIIPNTCQFESTLPCVSYLYENGELILTLQNVMPQKLWIYALDRLEGDEWQPCIQETVFVESQTNFELTCAVTEKEGYVQEELRIIYTEGKDNKVYAKKINGKVHLKLTTGE